MRIPTLALTMAAAAVVALPASANADAPVAVDDTVTTTLNVAKSFNVLTNDTDAETDPLSMTVKTEPANGTLDCDEQTGECTYTPDLGVSGVDTFTYTVSDGTEGTATDDGVVTIETVNVTSITNASSPSANLTWPAKITATTPAPSATFSGVVKKTGGVVAPGVDVQLMEKPTGAEEYTPVENAVDTSDGLGKVSVTGIKPTSFTVYKWKAGNFMGQLSTLGVTPSLTGAVNKSNLAVGDTFTITGTSAPAAEGGTVLIQRRNPTTDKWEPVGNAVLGTPDANLYAEYSYQVPADVSGSYTYRAKLPADVEAGLNGAQTGQLTVKRYDARIQEVHPEDSDEYVIVKNNGNVALNLSGWVLSQGTTKTVTLPKWAVGKGDTVVIHSGRGINKGRHLYLKGADRWNGSGTLELHDKRGVFMDDIVYQ